jgi:DNA-binding CsgD family transcriptional regulator/PAS domain-containing protein
MILSEAEMDRDPVYQWYGDYGLRYFIGSGLPETDRLRLAWSLQRTAAEGHAQQPDVETFLMFKRHLVQAIALAARIGSLERKCRFGLGVLDTLPYAVFALDGAGRVLFMSRRAERLVQLMDGLLVHDGRLQARLALQQPLLDRLIRAAVSPAAGQVRGGWARLHRASGRRPYLALVSEFVGGEQLMDDFPARALVIINDPDGVAVPDQQALRELYDVTDSEARVALALASGHSIQSAAESLDISAETLRTHLKHIFRKLGVSRQQDLVRHLVEIGVVGGCLQGEQAADP